MNKLKFQHESMAQIVTQALDFVGLESLPRSPSTKPSRNHASFSIPPGACSGRPPLWARGGACEEGGQPGARASQGWAGPGGGERGRPSLEPGSGWASIQSRGGPELCKPRSARVRFPIPHSRQTRVLRITIASEYIYLAASRESLALRGCFPGGPPTTPKGRLCLFWDWKPWLTCSP